MHRRSFLTRTGALAAPPPLVPFGTMVGAERLRERQKTCSFSHTVSPRNTPSRRPSLSPSYSARRPFPSQSRALIRQPASRRRVRGTSCRSHGRRCRIARSRTRHAGSRSTPSHATATSSPGRSNLDRRGRSIYRTFRGMRAPRWSRSYTESLITYRPSAAIRNGIRQPRSSCSK